jgi:hypothetical protein
LYIYLDTAIPSARALLKQFVANSDAKYAANDFCSASFALLFLLMVFSYASFALTIDGYLSVAAAAFFTTLAPLICVCFCSSAPASPVGLDTVADRLIYSLV